MFSHNSAAIGPKTTNIASITSKLHSFLASKRTFSLNLLGNSLLCHVTDLSQLPKLGHLAICSRNVFVSERSSDVHLTDQTVVDCLEPNSSGGGGLHSAKYNSISIGTFVLSDLPPQDESSSTNGKYLHKIVSNLAKVGGGSNSDCVKESSRAGAETIGVPQNCERQLLFPELYTDVIEESEIATALDNSSRQSAALSSYLSSNFLVKHSSKYCMAIVTQVLYCREPVTVKCQGKELVEVITLPSKTPLLFKLLIVSINRFGEVNVHDSRLDLHPKHQFRGNDFTELIFKLADVEKNVVVESVRDILRGNVKKLIECDRKAPCLFSLVRQSMDKAVVVSREKQQQEGEVSTPAVEISDVPTEKSQRRQQRSEDVGNDNSGFAEERMKHMQTIVKSLIACVYCMNREQLKALKEALSDVKVTASLETMCFVLMNLSSI